MRPVDALRRDHDTIERALQGLDALCRDLERGTGGDLRAATEILRFLREFADGCHHRKEEELLFPALENSGVPRDGGPIGVMLTEHEDGRALIAAMIRQLPGLGDGETDAHQAFLEAATRYGCLLRSHIQKENGILFPIAERLLGEEVEYALEQGFTSIDRSLGSSGPEAYEALARELGSASCRVAGRSGGRP